MHRNDRHPVIEVRLSPADADRFLALERAARRTWNPRAPILPRSALLRLLVKRGLDSLEREQAERTAAFEASGRRAVRVDDPDYEETAGFGCPGWESILAISEEFDEVA